MKKISKIIFIIIISFSLNIKNIIAEELPKVYLTGDITEMNSKSDKRKIELHYKSDDLEFKAYTVIKIQGNSSLQYDKKNYNIKLYQDSKYKDKKNIDIGKNWGSQHEYYLKANWIDKTHSRNIVTANIVANMQKKYNLFNNTPNYSQIDGIPVEVYINDEFLGLYTWNIPKDNWMLNMNKDDSKHLAIISNKHSDTTNFKETTTLDNDDWEIEVGPQTNETIKKLNRLITFIKDSNNIEFKNKFENYLNLDATLNYYIILNVAKLSDNNSKNMLLITYDGKIWSPITYDLDTSWGTNYTGKLNKNYSKNLKEYLNNNLLWEKLEKNFSKEISNRYFELRKSILTKENILNEFNTFINSIPKSSIEKEINKWGENIPGYSISQIEEFLDTRLPMLDKEMYTSYNTTPQISIEYSNQNPTIKPITVKLIPNRTDISIIKDGKKSYDYIYTFTKNGEYTFEYQDWYGNNLGTLTITINNIKTKEITIILISTILFIIIGTIFIFISKKQLTNNKKSNSKKETKEKTKIRKKKTSKNKNHS